MRIARLRRPVQRTGTVAVWAALMISFLAGMVAFAVDLGYIALVRNHLQVAADAGAMAGVGVLGQDGTPGRTTTKAKVKEVAGKNYAGGQGDSVAVADTDIVPGYWNANTGVFTPGGTSMNAVKVTTRKRLNLFFGAVLGTRTVDVEASAIALKNQRDIAFVVDLSGSMNNDTEVWATSAINNAFPGFPTVGTEQMTAVLADFGFSTNPDGTNAADPATLKYIGEFSGSPVPNTTSGYKPNTSGQSAVYNYLTNNSNGYLKTVSDTTYKITSTSESHKKQKAYSWIIDKQLATLMPLAKPTPNSATNLAYWSAYLDYMLSSTVSIPSQISSNKITGGANPYADAWPELTTSALSPYQNKVGYLTYVQFMMDYGLNYQVPGTTMYTPLSRNNLTDCPWKLDTDANSPGYQLEFPPREQPTHAVRLAVMAGINKVKSLNVGIAENAKDHVCVITFDTATGTTIKYPLTATSCDYELARKSVRDMQALSDYEYSTASEVGLIKAGQHLDPVANPSGARPNSTKIVVFLSDGVPNVKSPDTTPTILNNFMYANPAGEWFTSGSFQPERNATLRQIMLLQAKGWRVHPVGVGLGADRVLMDKMARMAGTALKDPLNPTGPKISPFADGNPADYQARLTSIFGDIMTTPSIKLVQ